MKYFLLLTCFALIYFINEKIDRISVELASKLVEHKSDITTLQINTPT